MSQKFTSFCAEFALKVEYTEQDTRGARRFRSSR